MNNWKPPAHPGAMFAPTGNRLVYDQAKRLVGLNLSGFEPSKVTLAKRMERQKAEQEKTERKKAAVKEAEKVVVKRRPLPSPGSTNDTRRSILQRWRGRSQFLTAPGATSSTCRSVLESRCGIRTWIHAATATSWGAGANQIRGRRGETSKPDPHRLDRSQCFSVGGETNIPLNYA